jgi:negative regulator of sigma E activity
MALTGQLSDMSLAELIEFFCNQRKTGRLKIDYQRGHSLFFIREGELVDARVGALSGVEAVYFSLTLPNAAFDFSPDVLAQRRTINDTWTQVVLEGLRRLDEGVSPSEADAFGGWTPSESDLATMLNQVENLDAKQQSKTNNNSSSDAPFSMMVESASANGGSKKKWMVMGAAACVVLAVAVAAVPLMSSSPKPEAAAAPVAQPVQATPEANPSDAAASNDAAPVENADASAADADAARRDALERERRDRERKRKAEEAANKEENADPSLAQPKPSPAAATGPKSVRVTVTYDEAGRVTQASVAGTTPGAEAYGSTAVRIARGKHFPAGKAGSTVVTIPVN